MGKITITLPADRFVRLHELALQFGVMPEDIVRIGFETLIRKPEANVGQLIEEMRQTNADIFRRLA
jgi:hypothetical protein